MRIQSADIYSIPNAMSAIGFALVLDGTRKIDEAAGITEIAAGRTLDLLDGAAARALGQGSELGAAIDANCDKFGGLAILIAEWRKEIAPKEAIAAMFTQNLGNAIATGFAMKRNPGQDLKPSRAGKYAMFSQNLALGAYATSNVLKEKHTGMSKSLRRLGHVATGIGVGLFGATATLGYIKRAC